VPSSGCEEYVKQESSNKEVMNSMESSPCLGCSLTLKIEAEYSSEKSMNSKGQHGATSQIIVSEKVVLLKTHIHLHISLVKKSA
jgi:hypothetical protein